MAMSERAKAPMLLKLSKSAMQETGQAAYGVSFRPHLTKYAPFRFWRRTDDLCRECRFTKVGY